jgi:CRISPR-associated endonuclease/helicase Cas3
MANFFAHSGKLADLSDGQPLREHLEQVGSLARKLALGACPANQNLALAAYVTGLLHDLGKYRDEFQLMLAGRHPKNSSTWHKQAGAVKAEQMRASAEAFAVLGHHGGLPDRAKLQDDVRNPANRNVLAQIWDRAVLDLPALSGVRAEPANFIGRREAELFTRLLFSCLVDADWSDTAEFERKLNGWPADPSAATLAPAERLECLLGALQTRAHECRRQTPMIAEIREEILNACLYAGERRMGLFSLTVPTGGGKTLAGLAFALRHAQAHGLRRVIYVAPYLTILEQNARAIREGLEVQPDDPTVLEHHSLAEPPGGLDQQDTRVDAAVRRAECWEAPIIITTNVQFFESLFANKPGRCRKVHNIARSVIILDECQALPPDLMAPTCYMIGQLRDQLGCSVVLCTATQPAFEHPAMKEERLQNVAEIIPQTLDLFQRLRRVVVEWPNREETPLAWSDVAAQMRAKISALCVVNTKRAARDLFAELIKMGGDAFHLSTSMCPAHRLAVLDEVRARLRDRRPCFLVSTQLIEAGVDVDFPLVMRELGPLEAIIQAAGRCNREGKLNKPDGTPGGRVIVFRSMEGKEPNSAWYKAGRSVVETSFLNTGREPRIDTPADVAEYFERLYHTGDLDQKKIQSARERFEFATVAEEYRLIDDDGIPVVIATWRERESEVEQLLNAVRCRPVRANYRKLVPFQVQCRSYEVQKAGGSIAEEMPGRFVWRGGYDDALGLVADNADVLLLI